MISNTDNCLLDISVKFRFFRYNIRKEQSLDKWETVPGSFSSEDYPVPAEMNRDILLTLELLPEEKTLTVKLLLSRPAGGKTTSCIKEIIEKRKTDPMAPVKVIVQDKMQMAYWKQTLSRRSWSSEATL